MSSRVLGLDIGGANLKAAHTDRVAVTRPFALWKNPGGLTTQLSTLFDQMPPADRLAVTMTGELCDCFTNRTEGVHAILAAVEEVAGDVPVAVWQNHGEFVMISEARHTPLQTASANWLALATYAGRFAPSGPALLVDIGSTTTDIVPLVDGQPQPRGRTDLERLREHELVYLGASRTPLFAVLPAVPLGGRLVWLIPELFAAMRDVLLVLGMVPEEAQDTNTADNRPATRRHAHARIARHFGADAEMITNEEIYAVCTAIQEALIGRVSEAIGLTACRTGNEPRTVVSAGAGEFLVPAALRGLGWKATVRSLAEQLGPELSTAAPAYAVAVLAAERFP